MDVREKLVELIGNAPVWVRATKDEACAQVADYLIAHGVTVQEYSAGKDINVPTNADRISAMMDKEE